jgi:PAS domain S-box-containing protein
MKQNSGQLRRWQWLLLLLLLLVFVAVTELLLFQERERRQHVAQLQVGAVAGQLRALLETEINAPLYLTSGLVAYIQAAQGKVSAAEFALLLPALHQQARHLRNLGIAPGNRLTYIYPLQGNEAAVGIYYPDLAEQWPDIAHLIQQRKPLLSGPLLLAQGGMGFVHRTPVYLTDGQYWGIVSTVLNIDSIWQLLAQQAEVHQMQVALRRNGPSHWSDVLFGERALFQQHNVILDLNISGARWQLAVADHQRSAILSDWPLRLAGWTLSLLLLSLFAAMQKANRRWINTANALQQSEKYYRTVLDHVADAIIVLDAQGRIENLNRAALSLLGYQPAQLLGQSYQLLFTEPLQLQLTLQPQELSVRHQSGSALLVELMLTRINEPRQVLTLLLLHDITERKRVEQLKNEFVSTVSHELRTPLTAINGALGLLTGGVVGSLVPAQQQLLDIAWQNSQQLANLINDLLDIEKLAAGKMQLYLQLLPVFAQVLQAKNRNAPLAEQAGVKISIRSDVSDEVKILIDENRLQQVFANLLANAIRFSPLGGVVLLEARLIGVQVRISVSDQGPGVPEDFVPRLFQKFSQADSSDSRRLNGTGLGLAICRELMDRMNGSIGYQPREGGGACFYFDLPVQ